MPSENQERKKKQIPMENQNKEQKQVPMRANDRESKEETETVTNENK